MSEIISDDAGADTLAVTGTAGEVHLWQSVIVGAINDWRSGPLRLQRIAEHFLFEDNDDFPLVCSSAGIDCAQDSGDCKTGYGIRRGWPRHEP
jgi:hypothetical protein